MECSGIAGRTDRQHDQVPAENVARAVRARSGHSPQDSRMDRRAISGSSGFRKTAEAQSRAGKRGRHRRVAGSAARIYAGGHQHRRRADSSGSAHGRIMEQTRTVSAYDVCGGTAAPPEPQTAAWPTSSARPGQSAWHRQIAGRTAAQIRTAGRSLRPPDGQKAGRDRREPRQTGGEGESAAQGWRHHRGTRDHAVARRA